MHQTNKLNHCVARYLAYDKSALMLLFFTFPLCFCVCFCCWYVKLLKQKKKQKK